MKLDTLTHVVEARSRRLGGWGVIAAFNTQAAANGYARDCVGERDRYFEYRVRRIVTAERFAKDLADRPDVSILLPVDLLADLEELTK